MNKKIEKKQKEISEAQELRARRKVIYDAQVVILEGQRNTVRELEKRSELMLNDYIDSDNQVKKLINELNELSNQIEEKENGTKETIAND